MGRKAAVLKNDSITFQRGSLARDEVFLVESSSFFCQVGEALSGSQGGELSRRDLQGDQAPTVLITRVTS